MDYFVTLIEDGHKVMSFVVVNAADRQEAEELALAKYPTNPLTGNPWTDDEIIPAQKIDAITLARAFRLTKKSNS